MKLSKRQLFWAIPLLLALGCGNDKDKADAYGNFEAKVVIVASETAGRLINFEVEQGQELEPGKAVGLVDTTQVSLQLDELAARRRQVGTRTSNVVAQIDVVRQQMEVLEKERARVEKLVAAGAATPKQLDDINGQLKVLGTQRQSINAQNLPVANEIEALDIQAERLRDMLKRSRIVNPIRGRVLEKLAEATEVVAPGRPLYRIAPMDSLYLRAYMSGAQLSQVQIGQSVTVRIDNGEEAYFNYTGRVTWIADQAEFTPKIVQTKEERINLVYAFKVMVKNDGRLKIGMPGEVKFNAAAASAEPTKTAENK